MQELRKAILSKMAAGLSFTVLDVVTRIAGDPETDELAWTSDIIDMLEDLAEEGRIHKLSDDGMHLTREYISYDMVSP